jgi:acyl-CoA thioesterase I
MKVTSLTFITFSTLILAIALEPLQSVQAAKPSPKMITILALGDSLTDGFGLTRKEAYPALLGEKMRSASYRYEMTNAGTSGDTTANGLRRLPSLLQRKRLDILIVALGINDAFRGVPLDQTQANLQAIIDQTRNRFPLVSIVIAGIRFPFPSENGYIQAFEQMYSSLAEQNHAAFVPNLLDNVAGIAALNQVDMIHPNAEGQRILADNVWRILEPLVKQKAEKSATD